MTNDFQYVSFNLTHVYIATLVYMIWIFFFFFWPKFQRMRLASVKKKNPSETKVLLVLCDVMKV